MGLSTTTLEPSLVTEGRRKAGAAIVQSPPSGGSTPSRRPPPPRSLQLLVWAEPRLLRDLVDRVLRGLEIRAVDLAVELDRVDLPAERDEPLDVRIAALAGGGRKPLWWRSSVRRRLSALDASAATTT